LAEVQSALQTSATTYQYTLTSQYLMRWYPLCFLAFSVEALQQVPGSSLNDDFFETLTEDFFELTANQEADVALDMSGSQSARRHHVGGLQRAASLNQCGAAKQWQPAAQRAAAASENFKAVYALNGKAASTMIRSVMEDGTSNREVEHLTWFSFVRDPVLRAVSGFFEIHILNNVRDVCMENAEHHQNNPATIVPLFCKVGINPYMASLGDKAPVLARFEAMVTALENRTFEDCHMDPQHGHVYAVHRLNFIGRVESLQADWDELGKLQADKFGVSWAALPNLTVRSTPSSVYDVFSIKSIPDGLVKRLCNFYIDDYCCNQLPFPSQCHELSC